MATLNPENKMEAKGEDEAYRKTYAKYDDTIQSLPKEKGWLAEYFLQYQHFWLSAGAVKSIMLLQNHFHPQATDIFLATPPKSGTTWLKALVFAIANRNRFEFSSHPLLTSSAHECVPFLEKIISEKNHSAAAISPRLFSTHIPFSLLPKKSVINDVSNCRIIYLCRDPKDVLVSMWVFANKSKPKELPTISLEEMYDLFIRGVILYGPFWDHVLGYWKASLENPNKVLFLKYEDLKRDPLMYVRSLASFLGQPLTQEEEANRVAEEIVRLCSFENLSNLEVNERGVQKFDVHNVVVHNRDFFRKGTVGDWKNHLTEEMVKHIDRITEEKLYGFGLKLGA